VGQGNPRTGALALPEKMAMRRASSIVSIFACSASVGLSRE
jgi:hypothetical protein